MKETSNIGKTDLESIRLNGLEIQNLPIRESVLATQQIPLVEDTFRKNKINGILTGAPKATTSYLESRIKECRENILQTNNFRMTQIQKITEYQGHISMCRFRDEEIARIDEDDLDKKEKIKNLRKRFPLYNVEAMEQQITQFNDSINQCDVVVKQENNSIEELQGTIQLCKKRDADLQNLGAKIA